MIPMRALGHPGLLPGDVAIAIAIAVSWHDWPKKGNPGPGCSASIRKLAEEARVGRHACANALRRLEQAVVMSAAPDPLDRRRIIRRIIWLDQNGREIVPPKGTVSQPAKAAIVPFEAKNCPLLGQKLSPQRFVSRGKIKGNQPQQETKQNMTRERAARCDGEPPHGALDPLARLDGWLSTADQADRDYLADCLGRTTNELQSLVGGQEPLRSQQEAEQIGALLDSFGARP